MADYNAWQDREPVLAEAARLTTEDRQAVYSDSWTNHSRIAALWSPILGVEVTPEQAALCMIQVKVSRLIQTPDHRDSVVDIAGYANVYAEIVGR